MPVSTINLSQEKMKFFLSNMFSHDSALHDFVDMLRLILTRDYMNRTILPPGFMAGGGPTDKGQHGGMEDDGEDSESDASQGAEGVGSMSQDDEHKGSQQGTAQADTRAAEEGVAGAPTAAQADTRAAEEGVAGAPRAAQAEEQRQQEVTHQTQSKYSRLKRKAAEVEETTDLEAVTQPEMNYIYNNAKMAYTEIYNILNDPNINSKLHRYIYQHDPHGQVYMCCMFARNNLYPYRHFEEETFHRDNDVAQEFQRDGIELMPPLEPLLQPPADITTPKHYLNNIIRVYNHYPKNTFSIINKYINTVTLLKLNAVDRIDISGEKLMSDKVNDLSANQQIIVYYNIFKQAAHTQAMTAEQPQAMTAAQTQAMTAAHQAAIGAHQAAIGALQAAINALGRPDASYLVADVIIDKILKDIGYNHDSGAMLPQATLSTNRNDLLASIIHYQEKDTIIETLLNYVIPLSNNDEHFYKYLSANLYVIKEMCEDNVGIINDLFESLFGYREIEDYINIIVDPSTMVGEEDPDYTRLFSQVVQQVRVLVPDIPEPKILAFIGKNTIDIINREYLLYVKCLLKSLDCNNLHNVLTSLNPPGAGNRGGGHGGGKPSGDNIFPVDPLVSSYKQAFGPRIPDSVRAQNAIFNKNVYTWVMTNIPISDTVKQQLRNEYCNTDHTFNINHLYSFVNDQTYILDVDIASSIHIECLNQGDITLAFTEATTTAVTQGVNNIDTLKQLEYSNYDVLYLFTLIISYVAATQEQDKQNIRNQYINTPDNLGPPKPKSNAAQDHVPGSLHSYTELTTGNHMNTNDINDTIDTIDTINTTTLQNTYLGLIKFFKFYKFYTSDHGPISDVNIKIMLSKLIGKLAEWLNLDTTSFKTLIDRNTIQKLRDENYHSVLNFQEGFTIMLQTVDLISLLAPQDKQESYQYGSTTININEFNKDYIYNFFQVLGRCCSQSAEFSYKVLLRIESSKQGLNAEEKAATGYALGCILQSVRTLIPSNDSPLLNIENKLIDKILEKKAGKSTRLDSLSFGPSDDHLYNGMIKYITSPQLSGGYTAKFSEMHKKGKKAVSSNMFEELKYTWQEQEPHAALNRLLNPNITNGANISRLFISNSVNAKTEIGDLEYFCPISSIMDNMPQCGTIQSSQKDGVEYGTMDVLIKRAEGGDPQMAYRVRVEPKPQGQVPTTAKIYASLQIGPIGGGEGLIIRKGIPDVEDWPGRTIYPDDGGGPITVQLGKLTAGQDNPLDAKTCLKKVFDHINSGFTGDLKRSGYENLIDYFSLDNEAAISDHLAGIRTTYTGVPPADAGVPPADALLAETNPLRMRRDMLETSFVKGLGDYLQEINGVTVNGGYLGDPIAIGQQIESSDGLRLQLSNDRPSGMRALLMLLFPRPGSNIRPDVIAGYLTSKKYAVAGLFTGTDARVPLAGGRKRKSRKHKRKIHKTKKQKKKIYQKKSKQRVKRNKRTRR
jgi:hypothetical protein